MSPLETEARIAFFQFESRDIATYPTLLFAAQLLARAGFDVDVFLPEHMMPAAEDYAHVHFIRSSGAYSSDYIHSTVSAVRSGDHRYIAYFASFFEGLAIAALLQSTVPAPIVYISMELLYDNYSDTLRKQIKRTPLKYKLVRPIASLAYASENLWKKFPCPIRRLAARIRQNSGVQQLDTAHCHLRLVAEVLRRSDESVALSIVQDRARERLLREEFSFVKETCIVPNSYPGYSAQTSAFAFERFGISRNKKILVYAGAVERGFDHEFFDFVSRLPDEFVLFVNAYSRDGYLLELKSALLDLQRSGRLFLNDELLDSHDYQRLIMSSYIGIAWYGRPRPGDHNMYYLGRSSGKICRFLSCGRPIVAPNYYHALDEWIDGNGVGVTCSSVAEIPDAVAQIDKNYAMMTANVERFYRAELDFNRCFEPVLAWLTRQGNSS